MSSDAVRARCGNFHVPQSCQCWRIGINRSYHFVRGVWTPVAESSHFCLLAPGYMTKFVATITSLVTKAAMHENSTTSIISLTIVRSPRAQPLNASHC